VASSRTWAKCGLPTRRKLLFHLPHPTRAEQGRGQHARHLSSRHRYARAQSTWCCKSLSDSPEENGPPHPTPGGATSSSAAITAPVQFILPREARR
jgi:hypothetical protein